MKYQGFRLRKCFVSIATILSIFLLAFLVLPNVSTAGEVVLSLFDVETQDITIEVKAKDPGTGTRQNFFLIFAFNETTKTAYLAGARVDDNKWTIEELDIQGTRNLLAASVEPIYTDTWYNLKIVIQGETVTLYVDDTEKVSYTFPVSLPNLEIGVAGQNNHALFDDLTVTYDTNHDSKPGGVIILKTEEAGNIAYSAFSDAESNPAILLINPEKRDLSWISGAWAVSGEIHQTKVAICHIPPGNPENYHTIVVSRNAVNAHLAHGDYLGDCVINDSDDDAVNDEDDNCPFIANPDQTDGDGDGVGDVCDACPLDNPDDSDGDGVCDSADVCPGSDDAVDSDGDGIADGCDACPADNPDDTDGDGVCDSDDACPGSDDTVDSDGDGTADCIDSCPACASKTEPGICGCGVPDIDSDGDGTVDCIDACPNDPDNHDGDGDGVCDDADNCPLISNAEQADTDGDGTGDACESTTGNAQDIHVLSDYGPKMTCEGGNFGCHGTYDPSVTPLLGDGLDLTNTAVCDECHSADGVEIAKQYWNTSGSSTGEPGSWRAVEGDDSYCGSCHDGNPGYNGVSEAFDVMGDNATYGFFVTGHGKDTGNYASLSWQDSSATGNPAANRTCSACHELTSLHFGSSTNRLKAGYENNQNNDNCNNCHAPAGSAIADPQFYTESVDYEGSAHGGNLCTECHDVHGTSGSNAAMTNANQESLCYQCHTEGGMQNIAISGAALADDIEESFGVADEMKHNMGASYSIGTSNYSLECVSCHNVHLVSGKYWEADQNKSPVTSVSTPTNPGANLEVWGDEAGEKMDDYGGTYRTPNGDQFSGAELPDYATFCLECHAEPGSAPFGIDWVGRPHGKQSANNPNGYGTCPNWYGCGKAESWDNDDCIGTQEECWPVITRGKGDQVWTRKPYNHEERISGANFTLSCTDCHEAHGSKVRSMMRKDLNNWEDSGTTTWNTSCNACHYYYSDWHAGMSCGTASCHTSNSIHRMGAYSGTSMTRSFDPDLVLHYAFENNLKDSGDWQMDAKWQDNIAGSYATGKYGTSAVLSGGMNIQVGTENDDWSTHAGSHGTHIYTDMKYNTTLEAWVYPTDDTKSESSIFTKHVGYNDGGYAFTLKRIGDTYRAAFNMRSDSNAGDEGGASGVRGAYSSVAIPLNTWSHVAATFDTAGADRDDNDPSVGRIRIYVNGEDVTTSDAAGNFMQPLSGETSIYEYVENSPWNEGICYAGHWCASEFSVGGFYGWQDEFIGRLDEAKVWNITKDAGYFADIDALHGPEIVYAEIYSAHQILVTFSEGVFGSGLSSELVPSDFVLNCSGNTIVDVLHTAGGLSAILTLNSPVGSPDSCTVSGYTGSIIDDYSNAVGSSPVSIAALCPDTGIFKLNEPAGSSTASDEEGVIIGTVSNPAVTFTGDGYFHGDGSNNYIMFSDADSCFKTDTALTLEARFKPTGIPNDDSTYIQRIFAKAGDNYQISVWRNEDSAWKPPFDPPGDTVVLAFWVKPLDAHGGADWKPLKTDYSLCPVRNDHWYQAKVVWDSAKTGGIPGDIFVDDLGTDGTGTGEVWNDFINCTDSEQLQTPDDKKFQEGDQIHSSPGDLSIGANDSGNLKFNGLIDWVKIQMAADYSLDSDGDGYGPEEDCDDADPAINPGELEIQNNGIDDDCDPLTSDGDVDNDGISNAVDNCPFIPNTDQTDSNGDGQGDACEISHGRLYSVEPSGAIERLIAINTETAEVETVCLLTGLTGIKTYSLAFSPDDDLYGWDSTNHQLFNINPDTCEVSHVGSSPAFYEGITGLAFDYSGTLYALTGATDQLYTIDTATSDISVIGESYLDIQHDGLAVDFNTGDFYAVTGCEDGKPDYLLDIYRDEPAVFNDDFSLDPDDVLTWTPGGACGTCTHIWDSINDEINIRTNPSGPEGSSLTAKTAVPLPSSGYAALHFSTLNVGSSQDGITFFLYQDAANYYKFVVSSEADSNTVEKVVDGSMTDIGDGGDAITADTDYTMEVWWSPRNLRVDINGATISNIETTDTTILTPASLAFEVDRINVDWESIDIYSGFAQIIGELGVDYCGVCTEFNPETGELFSIRDNNILMKLDINTGNAVEIGVLDGVSTVDLAALWPEYCPDSDGDGVDDCDDNCPDDAAKVEPGICGCGMEDTTDSDGDGTADCIDQCVIDPAKVEPGICGCGVEDTDSDNDGTADCIDQCVNDPAKVEPGICGCGLEDTDSDNDGTADCIDQCVNDPEKVEPGICGCGVADTDSDSDGTADCIDQCVNDPVKVEPGICGCGVADTDSDSDGTADCIDQCVNDPAKVEPGICGCGVADTDSDSDGTPDCYDCF